jgi:hypothetical protein
MNKLILNPGNGISFPKHGDYVLINLCISDSNNTVLLNSKKIGGIDVLYGEKRFVKEFEELIGEMSLFEKCSFEINESGDNDVVRQLAGGIGNLNVEIEILDISNYPHK